jgi:Fur family ferric uptake transcriptional regulator
MSHCHTVIEALRERGYRLTPQREMIVEAMADEGRHMTAEEIFERVQARTRAVNIATVYRTLDLLVEEGLASRMDVGSGHVVYATAHHGRHIHLVCRQCGGVLEADAALFGPLIGRIEAEYRFTCGPEHFAIYGLCALCRPDSSDD